MKAFVSSLKDERFDVSMVSHGSIRPREIPRGYPTYSDGVPCTSGFLHIDGRLVLTNEDDPLIVGYHDKIRGAFHGSQQKFTYKSPGDPLTPEEKKALIDAINYRDPKDLEPL
jgi:hypothetical protein